MKIIRQGDVCLVQVKQLPKGCTEIPLENGRIVLMHGEVTGHAHAIADWQESGKIAQDAIGLAGRRARFLRAPNGDRFLEVSAPVNLEHEEHRIDGNQFPQFKDFEGSDGRTIIPPDIYGLPQQMEHSTERMRPVQD